MIISEVVTLAIYAFSMIFLPEYFGTLRGPPLRPERNLTFVCHRSNVCHLYAFRVESCSHGSSERVATMGHQVDQESRCT